MNIRIGSGLLLQAILVVILILIINLIPSSILQIVIGLPFALFFPGYTLVLALFPDKVSIGKIERVALSFGLSIAIVPLIGLILNYTPWGITIESTLYSIAGFIFALSLIAWFRLQRISEYVRFSIEFQLGRPSWGNNRLDRVLSIVLVVAIMGAIGTLSYSLAVPKVGERFTEFYILGPEGKAESYPNELSVGQEGTVIAGIINHEQEATTYRIEILINGAKNNEFGPINLENEGKWEEMISFAPNIIGNDQKVEFLLYKGEQSEAYRSLHLWVDIQNE